MTTLTFPFTSATAEEHLKALQSYYPNPVSADQQNRVYADPEDYCVAGGLCRYILGDITNWEVDDTLNEIQDIIYKSVHYEYEDGDMADVKFPENDVVAEALSYIAFKYHSGYIEELLKQEIENNPYHDYVGGFFKWLATNLIDSNDEEDFKQAWFYCAVPFYKFDLQYATWDYLEYLEEYNLTILS